MCRVDGNVVRDQSGELSISAAGQTSKPSPEHAVVHDEQLRSFANRRVDDTHGKIDGHGDAVDVPGVGQLNAIERIRIIWNSTDIEQIVEIRSHLGEGRHQRFVVAESARWATVNRPAPMSACSESTRAFTPAGIRAASAGLSTRVTTRLSSPSSTTRGLNVPAFTSRAMSRKASGRSI